MIEKVLSALLCPIRVKDDEVEVFMVRRYYWDEINNRPMTYPGEWVFSGGKKESRDSSLLETAKREFREELGYEGKIQGNYFLRSAEQNVYGIIHSLGFYASKIDDTDDFNPSSEIIDYRWIRPKDAIELVTSDKFTLEQISEYKRRGLDDSTYGIYSAKERKAVKQNIETLKLIGQMPEIKTRYG